MYRDMIIFVAGTICSGKTFEAAQIADELNFDFIEISSIVRQILETNRRDKLQGHPELSTQIIDRITEIRRTTKKQGLVVSGPRQIEIVKAFPEAEFNKEQIQKMENLQMMLLQIIYVRMMN